MNRLVVVAGVVVLGLAFFACGKSEPAVAGAGKEAAAKNGTDCVVSPADLARADGRDGRPAWIAVDGIVYDVTGVAAWKDGVHKGFRAGQDATERLKQAPHGNKVLAGLKQVGPLGK